MSKASKRLQTLKEGKVPQVSKEELWRGEVGQVPGIEERAILALARAISHAQDPDYVSISWANQCAALEYHNANGLVATLARAEGLWPATLDEDSP